MENTPSTHDNKKKIIISILIVLVFAILIFLFFKFNKTGHEEGKPYTEEDKIEILNNLRSTPPNDGSKELTIDERIKILDDLSNKK